jgi:hypothetical protein
MMRTGNPPPTACPRADWVNIGLEHLGLRIVLK